MNTSTQKTNVFEYDDFRMYSNTNMITLECNHDYFHDYFHDYPVSTVKATSMESPGVILFAVAVSISSVLTDYYYPISRCYYYY